MRPLKNPVLVRTRLFVVRMVHCSKSCATCPHGPYVYTPHGDYIGHADYENIVASIDIALNKRPFRRKKINPATKQRLCTIAEKIAQSVAAGAAAGATAHLMDLV